MSEAENNKMYYRSLASTGVVTWLKTDWESNFNQVVHIDTQVTLPTVSDYVVDGRISPLETAMAAEKKEEFKAIGLQPNGKLYNMADVGKHNSEVSPWVVVKGRLYKPNK